MMMKMFSSSFNANLLSYLILAIEIGCTRRQKMMYFSFSLLKFDEYMNYNDVA